MTAASTPASSISRNKSSTVNDVICLCAGLVGKPVDQICT